MKKPEIIIFYPTDREIQSNPVKFKDVFITAFTFQDILQKEDTDATLKLVIIWDSTKEESGMAKLDEIKRLLPAVPLFLIAGNPSREYLMAAVKYRVDQLFSFPPRNNELQDAIGSIFQASRDSGNKKKINGWFQQIQHKTIALIRSFSAPDRHSDDLSGLELAGIAPYPFFPFLNKKLEQENTCDINVQFFGHLNIKIKGKTVAEASGKKNATVLAYLLFHNCKSIHKDILMDTFWSDVTPSSARNSLNVAICSIRKTLSQAYKAQEIILYNSENYCINPEMEIVTDVEKFIYFWKKGRAIESTQGLADALGAYNRAVNLYKDEFLANIRFDEWCESERDNLREIYLFILNRLSIYSFDHKNFDACINICRKMLDKDECLEDIHRKLMTCYYALGLTDMALKQYFKCEKALEKEFGLKPSEPTKELLQKIQNGKSVMV